MKRYGIAIAVIAVLALGAYALYSYFHRNAQSGRLNLLNAEYSYLTTLQSILKKQPNPESGNNASAFVSVGTLNSVLGGFDGLNVSIPHSSVTLKIKSVRTDFRDGFPGVAADVQVTRQTAPVQLDATMYALLEPRLDKSNSSTLLLYMRPLYLNIALQPNSSSKDILKLSNGLLNDIAAEYSETLPHLTLPLAHEFTVIFPPSHLPLSVPVQAGKLNGEIDVPGLSARSGFAISGVLFLSDGVHVLLATNAQTQTILPYALEAQSNTYSSEKALDTAIKDKEEQIHKLRSNLQTLTNPLKVEGSDIRIWISKGLLSLVGDLFNSLSPAERRVHYHTISEEGQLYRTGGGGAGCGGYAEVVGGNSANANLQISNLVGTWTNQGFSESADFEFAFDAQVTGHVNGPAGPHPTMVSNCVEVFHKKMCTDLPSVTVSCETPVGGGVGLGSYGVHGTRTEKLTATMLLHSDESSWLSYDLAITSPDQIPITLEVGLGQLGTLGIPISFSVPHQTIVSGKAPAFFSQSGTFEVPVAHAIKKYALTVTPTKSTVQEDGYVVVGKVNIQWQ